MTAKRGWTIWTHFGLALMVTAEAAFVVLAMKFVMPKCMQVVADADLDHRGINAFMPCTNEFLGVIHLAINDAIWWAMPLAIAWGLFEWRVRGEKKTRIRLSVMGTTALALFAVVGMSSAVMAIPTTVAAARLNARQPERIVRERMAALSRLVPNLDQAVAKKDWPTARYISHEAGGVAEDFAGTGAAAPALLTLNEPAKIDELRAELNATKGFILDAYLACKTGDAERVETAMRKFHEVYTKVENTAVKGSESHSRNVF